MRQSRKQSSGRSGRGSVSHFSCCCTFYERCVLFVCVRWARARARARARAWTRARAQARARARSHPRTHTHTCTQTLTKHARSRTRFKRTGGATTQHERGFVARSTCLGLGLRERGPLGLGGREVHGRGLSRPRVRFCSALGVDGVACGSVAAHPKPANATTTLNAERIDVLLSVAFASVECIV